MDQLRKLLSYVDDEAFIRDVAKVKQVRSAATWDPCARARVESARGTGCLGREWSIALMSPATSDLW